MDGRRPVRADGRARDAYTSLRTESDTWAARERQLAARSPAAALLLEDVFYALYGAEVELDPETSLHFHWQFKTMAEMLPLADFQRLRERTVGDVVVSAMSAWRLVQAIMDELANQDNHGRRRWVRLPKVRDLDQERSADRRPDGRGKQTVVVPMYAVQRAVRDVRGMADGDARLRGVWGIGPGQRSVHELDDIWRLVDDVRALPGFDTLTEAFDQFRQMLTPGIRRRQQRPGVGVERLVGWARGNDLERVIPEEMVRLIDPDLQPLFFEAYEHGRLLQARFEGDRRGPTGPIVCCMDVSRSMNAPAAMGRERFLWAKAVGLALLDFARRARRPFVGICFSSENDLAVFELPADSFRPDLAIAMAACDYNGGTNFQSPLNHALSHLQRAGGHDRGHIVFITDGEAALPERFRRRFTDAKAMLRFRLMTVFIDGRHDELTALSDDVFDVRSDRVGSWEKTVSGVGQLVAAPAGG